MLTRGTYSQDITQATHSEGGGVVSAVTLLYVANIPFDIFPVAMGRTFTGPLAVLLIGAWIYNGLRNSQVVKFPLPAGMLLFLYSAWIICTVFWSVDTGASMSALQSILIQVAVAVVLSHTLAPVWFKSLVTLGCSTAVLGLIVLSRPANALRAGQAQVAGIDENITAMVLTVGFAALVYAVIHLHGRRAAMLVLPTVVTGAATLHVGSRTGAIAVAGILVVALLPLIRQGGARPVMWFRVAGIILFAYFSYLIALDAGLLPQRVLDLLNDNSAAFGDSGRSAIINFYMQTFNHWAMVGVGIGNDASYLFATQSNFHNAHSLFWKTWIETGLVGLLLLAGFLLVVVKQGFRCVAPQAAGLLAVPIVLFAITLGGADTSVFWFVMAFALTRSPEGARSNSEPGHLPFHPSVAAERPQAVT